jgi:Protein of unknown function (DUF992)
MIMFMLRTLVMITAVVPVLLPPVAGQTEHPGTHIGMLTCQMAPRAGLTMGSLQSISCHFIPDGGQPQQPYIGEIDTVGRDVGITTGGVLAWDVLASTGGQPAGEFAGVYVGTGSGDMPVGGGTGVNVLFGGSNRTIALRPFALEGEIEVALGLGISSLKLATAF